MPNPPHFTHDQAVDALKRYFSGDKTHAITGSCTVNTWRLYAMLNGDEHVDARKEFLEWLRPIKPDLWAYLRSVKRWRRGEFKPPAPMPLFEPANA